METIEPGDLVLLKDLYPVVAMVLEVRQSSGMVFYVNYIYAGSRDKSPQHKLLTPLNEGHQWELIQR